MLPEERRSAPAVATQYAAPQRTAAASATETRERALRGRLRAQHAPQPANGLTVPPPALQPGLQMLDTAALRPAPPTVDWTMPPAFPGEAAPQQPLKLPRQSKVQQVCKFIL